MAALLHDVIYIIESVIRLVTFYDEIKFDAVKYKRVSYNNVVAQFDDTMISRIRYKPIVFVNIDFR